MKIFDAGDVDVKLDWSRYFEEVEEKALKLIYELFGITAQKSQKHSCKT
ncbi:MAG: hypothetical protein SCK57_11915 [Bacillota bacterium]|nr:hypothetical protein [Bacillota bacterium]